ncbi:hypothetical protein NQ314_011417 [Rhamnusium bicolor]|uniref:Serendipity locus protein alpha n=1 Tax=Rhamnusium bicolor TaxID=1586634 RepID=A0AAV8XJ06_9CUCU|nr:hypothetical protein NQ314_011417 [Rhamnusium bicolor]
MALAKVCKLKNQLNTCNEFMETLNDNISENKELLLWFKQLCEHLTKTILYISELNKELKGNLEKGNKDTILLYLSQLITSLSLLINIFVRESDAQHILPVRGTPLRKKRQIVWCLGGIQETLTTNKSILDPGSFIKWMDSALDKIAEIEANKEKDDIIAVLESLDSLMKEINKSVSNPAMVNLFVDSCTDKLCSLERRVNAAVLKLSLKVFSEYTVALEVIYEFCFHKKNKGKVEELDSLIADFDLHVDRIMQIGLFAVSCSTCSGRGIKIRSCLASLEALECELVPALTSVLLNRSVHNKNLALLLKNHWLQQANILKELIYLIIDPFAFCQVIYEENKQIVDGLSEIVYSKDLPLDKKTVQPLINQSKVLQDFINVTLKEEQDTKIIEERFKELKAVLHEVKCASEVLLGEKANYNNKLRLLKRCKILMTTIKRLWHCFVEEDIENKIKSQLGKVIIIDLHIELQDLSATNSNEKPATGNLFLDHIINRGKQILKDRSVLYRSSMKSDTFNVQVSAFKRLTQFKDQNKSIPLSKLVHLRKLSFMSSVAKNDTSGELQITDILNELNNMTNTFTQ